MTPTALARLAAYAWPGNVRELENTLTRAVVLAKTDVLDETLLPLGASAPRGDTAALGGEVDAEGALPTLREIERAPHHPGARAHRVEQAPRVRDPRHQPPDARSQDRGVRPAASEEPRERRPDPARDRRRRRRRTRCWSCAAARRRDNLVFGLLTLTDAAMTAWRGLNVLTGGSITSRGVIDPVRVRHGRARALDSRVHRRVPAPGRRCAGAGGCRCSRGAVPRWCTRRSTWAVTATSSPAPPVVLLRADHPGDLRRRWVRVPAHHPARRPRGDRRAVVPLGRRLRAHTCSARCSGCSSRRVWAETTVATLDQLRRDRHRGAAHRAVLDPVRGGRGRSRSRRSRWSWCSAPAGRSRRSSRTSRPGQLQFLALLGATLVPLGLTAVGFVLYPRVERRVLAGLDERRARRLGVQGDPLPPDAAAAIAEATQRIATIADGATVRWRGADDLPAALADRLRDDQPVRREDAARPARRLHRARARRRSDARRRVLRSTAARSTATPTSSRATSPPASRSRSSAPRRCPRSRMLAGSPRSASSPRRSRTTSARR